MKQKHLSFKFQGRYYTSGGSDEHLEETWFVLHGQGQLAQYFLEKFDQVATDQRKIIAPEGLSRYYLDGFYGRVGATWMTREDRLTDISNYLEFLTQVYVTEVPQKPDCKITILGFSQGAATVSRWVLNGGIHVDRLILWGGLFPPDLDFKQGQEKMKDIEILNIYGLNDEYLNDARKEEQFMLAEKLGVKMKTMTFEGGHEIDQDTLMKLI